MRLAICILARNEAGSIGATLASLARQSIFAGEGEKPTVFVVPNGCTDDTAGAAETNGRAVLSPRGISFEVMNLPEPGKSRAWNRFVHGGVLDRFDLVAFVDSDIEFIGDDAIAEGVTALAADPGVQVYTGYPIKNISASARKTTLDKLSLATSRLTRYVGDINGSFYIARSECLATIWLPDETPGEDGFLNAMVVTGGFIRHTSPGAIVQSAVPTHYFEAHSPTQFFAHERRMIVGTMINRWIFEHLWSLKLTEPAGPLIGRWNAENPRWVEELIASHVRGRRWVVAQELITRRLSGGRGGGVVRRAASLAVLVPATLLTIPPAILANRVLRQRGAASIW